MWTSSHTINGHLASTRELHWSKRPGEGGRGSNTPQPLPQQLLHNAHENTHLGCESGDFFAHCGLEVAQPSLWQLATRPVARREEPADNNASGAVVAPR